MKKMADELPIIAIMGGTGNQGYGLALRWAKAGYKIFIGSRDQKKAMLSAEKINELVPPVTPVIGSDNGEAADLSNIAILAVPASAQVSVADEIRDKIKGKILIDVTVPLVPPKILRVQLPQNGSAVAKLQSHLGDEIQVVSAFQNIAAHHLQDIEHEIDCDVLVCGNKKYAREEAIKLVTAAGMRGWHAGPIDNSAAAEAMTSLLLFINKHYGIDGAGIRISGKKA